MITAENLTKHFLDFVAVDGIHLQVSAGQVLALLGPNGAGKTTTVRMLTSILTPTAGRAVVAGYDVVRCPEKVRASVGVLTEHHGLYSRMNSPEYLEFFGRLYGRQPAETRKKAAELLERFGLGPARSKRLGEYSKGMRQKLALVRALLHDPPVLLLDEPTSAMDPESARMVRDAIHTLRSVDRTIILCTHNLVEADELADQVAIIRNGKILLNDTTHEIKRQLLGPPEFEARLSAPWNAPQDWQAALPEYICLTQKTDDRLCFQVQNPEKDNPLILHWLLSAGAQVVSFAEVARSLEQAYLEAVSRLEKDANRV